jgi:hypothetical protein
MPKTKLVVGQRLQRSPSRAHGLASGVELRGDLDTARQPQVRTQRPRVLRERSSDAEADDGSRRSHSNQRRRPLVFLTLLLVTGCQGSPRVRWAGDETPVSSTAGGSEGPTWLPRYSREQRAMLVAGQAIVVTTDVANLRGGCGTLIRTKDHGLLLLTNRHVAGGLFESSGEAFVFVPEPQRMVDGSPGYALCVAKPHLPELAELRRLSRAQAGSAKGGPWRAAAAKLAASLGDFVEADLALLRVEEGGERLPSVAIARGAPERTEVGGLILFPEPHYHQVELHPDFGWFRAGPAWAPMGKGNSGSGMFDEDEGLIAVHMGSKQKAEGGAPSLFGRVVSPVVCPTDPSWLRTRSRQLLPLLSDPESSLGPTLAAMQELLGLWRPVLAQATQQNLNFVIRPEELQRWLSDRGVEVLDP